MQETKLPAENVADPVYVVDSNAEYILPSAEKKQPAVLVSVSRSILVETVKDLFKSISGFVMRYIRHFVRCLVYFISPSIQKKPFDQLDYKENSQHAFEFVIIVLAILIFMIKVGWIPPSTTHLLEVYENDIAEKALEITLFLLFAVGYIVLAGLSILFGRIFRAVFKIGIGKDESDILQVYLNNAFFSIAAVIALFVRSVASFETHDSEGLIEGLMLIISPVVGIPTLIWSVRYAMLHQMSWKKGTLFTLSSFFVFGLFYIISLLMICAFVIGI